MSFFGQVSHSYNAKDVGQNLSDIQGVLGLLSSETRKKFEGRVLRIASQKPEGLYAIRNKLYEACLAASRYAKVKGVSGLDKMNPKYQELLYIYDTVSRNPELRNEFIVNLSEQISQILQNEAPGIKQITVDTVTDVNFKDQIKFISDTANHAGVVYFLGECISEGKCLEMVKSYLDRKMSGKENLAGSTLEDLDYFNLSSRLSFRKKLDQSKVEGKSFSLSGGISNALSQVGYIREHYKKGGKIKSLSGTSMGGIVTVLIAKVVGSKTGDGAVEAIDDMMEKLQGSFTKKIESLGRVGKIPFLSIQKTPKLLTKDRDAVTKSDVEAIQDIFLNFAKSYGINEGTTFSELEIPVIVNASFQSQGGSGEKEVIISGDNSIIDALFAGANMPNMLQQNVGIFGTKKLRGLELVDFAANEKGNPISLLTRNGVNKSDLIALDVGYSSTEYDTGAASFSRGFFERALFRDMIEKSDIQQNGGQTADIDVRASSNASGSAFSAEIIQKLMKIGSQTYYEVNTPTSQSPQ